MNLKRPFDVGYFESATGDVIEPLDPAFVQQVIVQAGGELPGPDWPVWPNHAGERNGRRVWMLGYLGPELVIRDDRGVVTVATDGLTPQALAFLKMIAAEGCTIWWDGRPVTEYVLTVTAAAEVRWAAQKKA